MEWCVVLKRLGERSAARAARSAPTTRTWLERERTKSGRSSLVVRFSAKDRARSVELLDEYQSGQLMRKGPRGQ